MNTTADTTYINNPNLNDLELIAQDQNAKMTKRAVEGNWNELLEAIRIVRGFTTETAEWAACLRCGMAFPTSQELSRHDAAHR